MTAATVLLAGAVLWSSGALLADPLVPAAGRALRPPSGDDLFGTDDIGRDVLARVVAGTGPTLGTALLALALTMAGGTVLALVLGWWSDGAGGRVVALLNNVLLVFPPLWMPLVVVALLGRGRGALVLAVVLTALPEIVWVLSREVAALQERPFVEAARGLGLGAPRILAVEVLPHLGGSALVLALLHFRQAVLVVATLAFLGLGPPPPAPSWGVMIAEGRAYFPAQWWLVTFPTLALAGCIVSAGLLARLVSARRADAGAAG